MELSNSLVEEWRRAIVEMKGLDSGVEKDDRRSASEKRGRASALAHQLHTNPSREISQLLHAVLKYSPAVISVKDNWGRYLLVNGKFGSLYEVSQDRLGKITDYDLFPTYQADTLRANDLKVIATRQALEFEELISDPTEAGEVRTFLSLKFPIAGPDGFPYAVGGISTDVTDRKRSQRCLILQHAVTRVLVEVAPYSDAGPSILQAICKCLAWDIGLFWQVDPVSKLLRCADVWQSPDIAVQALERMGRGMTLSPGVGLAGRAWEAQQPVWVENVGITDGCTEGAEARGELMRSGCAIPIRNGGNVLGILEFFSHEIQRTDPDLLQVLAGIGSQVAQYVEHRQAERHLLERARELELARTIQLGLLPKSPPKVSGFVIDGTSHPAQETGGDYFDFIPMRDETLGIAIGDASGHGIASALVIAEARAFVRARATSDVDVGSILTLLNQQITEDWPENHFVTMFFARLDPRTRTITYTSAGHLPGYVFDGAGNVRLTLGSTNFPLGIDTTAEFPVAPPVVLEPGDLVLLLTDGVLEASNPEGEMFGIERAIETVRGYRDDHPRRIVTALLHTVNEFSPHAQTDDMTAIVLKVCR